MGGGWLEGGGTGLGWGQWDYRRLVGGDVEREL